MKTDKAFLAVPSASSSSLSKANNEIPLFLHLLKNALLPLPNLERILISARNEDQRSRIHATLQSEHDKKISFDSKIEVILDEEEFKNKGPASGILTAHSKFPDANILVLAVDFPNATAETLKELIRGHESCSDSPVTCFLHPEDGNPEVSCSSLHDTKLAALK